jgi:hypothetical protein
MDSETLNKIPNNIKNLQLKNKDNLFFYTYHNRYIKKLQKKDFDKEDPHYISTYSSFLGEVYENIIYELLLEFALHSKTITQFVLKGPHQKSQHNHKNGLMIDRNQQIVYKAGYKDVTEFDALFFTKTSVYFVESTIVKATTNLRKRLKKKRSLLEVLFPKLQVKALIILSEGALGVSVFPEYCDVWVTKSLTDHKLIDSLIHKKVKPLEKFKKYHHKKLINAHDISSYTFKYFENLAWVLKKSRKQISNSLWDLDIQFFRSQKLSLYFDIYSKLYIGYIDSNTLVKLLKHLNIKTISEDIPIEHIYDDQIIVTIEKNKNRFDLVYYLKIVDGKLKKLEVKKDTLEVSDKDPKGFTSSETKYLRYILKTKYIFSFEQLESLLSKNFFN